ncbi:bifunctional phosphoribosyl-AMP cyclohydrolase/phosphoribosyl-ATP diphosphatase HisIE [Hazenella sp. IB182357]|uniref:Histidine biosynthesis bifunctional protein HisIE n=1 Tax=Polycladospora coralii TaxID=2771432 RepID=A0A926NA73_9BACL|nr:bifunctional phosphoribosyl-AMP cyclohydrolase/phosphoribosyl-ATP diphosphatase HisIE [Polycladospora coralii]MBD1372742.1 bifunctional phosphoribosyl-AMP cyclohydrolase/phosphoribosyl-ATP diphosphatase HisIE [Polycladospora coralii]
MNIDEIQFDDNGLVPAIVQDYFTREVLTLAYMNATSLKKSIETQETWFFSRSRQELWHKGAESGNTQKIVEMRYDCDKDAVLALVLPAGPACHRGTTSCFTPASLSDLTPLKAYQILVTLEKLIEHRQKERPEGAYTTYLFEKGLDKILKKIGEEAAEVMIAAKNSDPEALAGEVADLIYHVFVLLQVKALPIQNVLSVLQDRNQKP